MKIVFKGKLKKWISFIFLKKKSILYYLLRLKIKIKLNLKKLGKILKDEEEL